LQFSFLGPSFFCFYIKPSAKYTQLVREWLTFTDHIIQAIDEINNPVVYMLWGKFAQNKMKLITGSNALVLTASHPSPFSANRGFFGCDHFIKCNGYLRSQSLEGINWFGKTIGEENVH
jgi:uracil-DNA glycosylase